MNPLSRVTRPNTLFQQLAQENEESATIGLFVQLYGHSESFQHWLREDYGKNPALREKFHALATGEPIGSIERFTTLCSETSAWDEERSRLKTLFPDGLYGGLTYNEVLKLIIRYQSGTIDKGIFFLAREWKRLGESAKFSSVLVRATLSLMESALCEGELRLLKHLIQAARFLKRNDSKPKRKAAVGFTDWWKLQVLLFILKHPRESYRARELRAHLKTLKIIIDTRDIRRFCCRHGIKRDTRAGRPKIRPVTKPER